MASATTPRALDLNVAFFLIDDISRKQFQRSLLATSELLQKHAAQKYSVFDFKRYNVVGPNSLPNQSPMFLGRLVNYSRPGTLRCSIITNDRL